MKSEAVVKNYSVKRGVFKNFAEFTRKSNLNNFFQWIIVWKEAK